MKGTTLTKGNVFLVLLKFSIPFLLTNLLQALYGAVDLFMVGRFSNAAGISAVSTGGQVMQTLTGLIIGLTTGGTVIAAQHFGAKKHKQLANATATALCIFGLFSLVLTLLFVFFLQPICNLMQVPIEARSSTRAYLFLCSLGIVFIVGFNTISGILRGLGDSRTPFYFMLIACITNIVGDFIFVGIWRLSAVGAALATVLAQALSLLLAAIHLKRHGLIKKFISYQPSVNRHALHNILGIGLPIAAQEGLVNLSFLFITAIINRMGLTASAAVGIVEKLIVFSMLPTTAFASAVSAMTAQNQGAGQQKRASQCLDAGIFLSLVFGVSCFLLAQLAPKFLISLFTADASILEPGALYLRSYSLDCIIVCFVFCMNTFFSGSGHAVFPFLHSFLTTFVIRIPLSYFFSRLENASLFLVGCAAPLASFLSLLLCFFFLNHTYKKREPHNGYSFYF